jgi:hypothetical protein
MRQVLGLNAVMLGGAVAFILSVTAVVYQKSATAERSGPCDFPEISSSARLGFLLV